MNSHDTQRPLASATGHEHLASVTDIAAVGRGHTSPSPQRLAYDAVVGYFRHDGYCIRVEYVASTSLWVGACRYDPDFGPLTGFAAYDRLHYTEFGSIACTAYMLDLTYRELADDPTWMKLVPVSQADLMRKALSLYAYVTKGDMMNAADDLVPNPSPERIDPDAA